MNARAEAAEPYDPTSDEDVAAARERAAEVGTALFDYNMGLAEGARAVGKTELSEAYAERAHRERGSVHLDEETGRITLAPVGMTGVELGGEPMVVSDAYARLRLVADDPRPVYLFAASGEIGAGGSSMSMGQSNSEYAGDDFVSSIVRVPSGSGHHPGATSEYILHELGSHIARGMAGVEHGHAYGPTHEGASGTGTEHNQVDVEAHHWSAVIADAYRDPETGASTRPYVSDAYPPHDGPTEDQARAFDPPNL